MNKAFVSWSGGKDCCLAAYKSSLDGYYIQYLLNMVTQDSQLSCSHGIASKWIKLQSEAMGIPLIQQPTLSDNYEKVFTETLLKLKLEGITAGIFGDIDFNAHREWIERVCGNAGIIPVLPLWLNNQDRIAQDFIAAGFKSIIVATRADLLGKEWLGRVFDTVFLKDLAAHNKDITPCGEAGEFHSLVIDGPLFKKRLDIRETEFERRNNHWFLNIQKCELLAKEIRK
jgi:diphthine-ammonia ligase